MTNHVSRRSFIGGSDARIIMGDDEAALLRLWREKRGEVEPEDLSANLIVQLGQATEDLNRLWYKRNTGQAVKDVHSCDADCLRPVCFYFDCFARCRLLRRNPGPPPFSSMKLIPARSSVFCIFTRASSDTCGPNPPSRRLTVGTDRPACLARSV